MIYHSYIYSCLLHQAQEKQEALERLHKTINFIIMYYSIIKDNILLF